MTKEYMISSGTVHYNEKPRRPHPPISAICHKCNARRPMKMLSVVVNEWYEVEEFQDLIQVECEWHLTGEIND